MNFKPMPLLAAILILTVFHSTAGAGAAVDAGPVTMELKGPDSIKSSRFPHRKHQKNYACKQCHHGRNSSGAKSPYFAGMEIKKCAFCHNKENMSNSKLNSFKLAAHGLCKECHKQNSRAAPTKCSGCHIR